MGCEVLSFSVAAIAPDPESGEVWGGGREGGTLHGWGCCFNTSRATSSRATVLFLSAMTTWVQVQFPVLPYLLSHSMMALRSLSSLFLFSESILSRVDSERRKTPPMLRHFSRASYIISKISWVLSIVSVQAVLGAGDSPAGSFGLAVLVAVSHSWGKLGGTWVDSNWLCSVSTTALETLTPAEYRRVIVCDVIWEKRR